MALIHCPHCGAQNFTMEGWEDLDHCSSCGRPLAGPERAAPERQARPRRGRGRTRGGATGDDCNARRPRPA